MEEEKKKTTFLFVFFTYLPVRLLKFRSGELVGCGIALPLDAELNSASNEYPLGILLTNPAVIIMFFQVFLVFGVARSVKSMPSGYVLDAKFNSASNELS